MPDESLTAPAPKFTDPQTGQPISLTPEQQAEAIRQTSQPPAPTVLPMGRPAVFKDPNTGEPLNLTAEQQKQARQSAGLIDPAQDMTPEQMSALAHQVPEAFTPLQAYLSRPDLQNNPEAVNNLAAAHRLYKDQTGLLEGVTPGSVAKTALGFVGGLAKYGLSLADIQGLTLAHTPDSMLDEQWKAEKLAAQQKMAEAASGTATSLQGIFNQAANVVRALYRRGQAIGEASVTGETAKEHPHIKTPSEMLTPEQKTQEFLQDVEQAKQLQAIATGKAGDPVLHQLASGGGWEQMVANLEKEGYGVRPEEVAKYAAGDPISAYAFGKGFGALGKLGELALPVETIQQGLTAGGNQLARAVGGGIQKLGTGVAGGAKAAEAVAPAAGLVTGLAKGAHDVYQGNVVEGFKTLALAPVAGEAIAKTAKRAAPLAEGIRNFGKQVATGENIPANSFLGSAAQGIRDALQATPTAGAELAKGVALDLGQAAAGETPEEKQGVGLGTIFGGISGLGRAVPHVVSGQIVGARDWGSSQYLGSNGYFDKLDPLHNQAYNAAAPGVQRRVNAIRAVTKGIDPNGDFIYAPRPAEGQPDTLPQQLVEQGVAPDTAQLWADQNGLASHQMPNGKTLFLARDIGAAPHEVVGHGLENVLGESIMRQMDQVVQSDPTYQKNWDALGQYYTGRLGWNGQGNWQDYLLDKTGWGANYGKEKAGWQAQQGAEGPLSKEQIDNAYQQAGGDWHSILTDQEKQAAANSYISREIFAENADALFKRTGPGLVLKGGLPLKIAQTVAAFMRAMGTDPLAGRTSEALGVPLSSEVMESIQKRGQERLEEKPVIVPETAKKAAAPVAGAAEPEAAQTARQLAQEQPNVPLPGQNQTQREIAGAAAEAFANDSALHLQYSSAPDEPAASLGLGLKRQDRRSMIEAFRNMPDVARQLFGKLFFPKKFIKTKSSGIQIQGWSPEVFAANAHRWSRFVGELAQKNPQAAQSLAKYEVGPQGLTEKGWQDLYADLQNFVANQRAGKTGAGEGLVVPRKVTEAGYFAPPTVSEAGGTIPQDKADLINMLFGFRLPGTEGKATRAGGAAGVRLPQNIAGRLVSEATQPGRTSPPVEPRGAFGGAAAERQGVAGEPVTEVNPYRAQLEQAAKDSGVATPSMIESWQNLNLNRIKEAELAPEQPKFGANPLTLQAGFLPKDSLEDEGYRFNTNEEGNSIRVNATKDNAEVGHLLATTHAPSKSGYVENVAVSPEHRDRGVAKAMYETLTDALRPKGIDTLVGDAGAVTYNLRKGLFPNTTLNDRGETVSQFQPQPRKEVALEGPDGKKYRATFDGYQDMSVLGRGMVPQFTALEDLPGGPVKGSTTYQPSLEKAGYKVPTDLPQPGAQFSPRQEEERKPIWYSQASRVIEAKMPNAASGEQVAAILRNPQNGVKADELKWSGLDDYLKGKQRVTKQEVQDYLKQSAVQVNEVVKGKGGLERLKGPDLVAELDRRSEENYGQPYAELEDGERREIRMQLEEQETAPSTEFEQYQLPGGENYRELLFTLPTEASEAIRLNRNQLSAIQKEIFDTRNDAIRLDNWSRGFEKGYNATPEQQRLWGEQSKAARQKLAQLHDQADALRAQANEIIKTRPQTFQSSHWGEPNVLAHARFNERTDADGKRMLFLEEIQSDWHQKGRKEGYGGEKRYEVRSERGIFTFGTLEEAQEFAIKHKKALEEVGSQSYPDIRAVAPSRVPEAPFKTSWHEMVFRRMVRWAAEHGFDKLGWTTGEQQAERYDLSKQLSRVRATQTGVGHTGIEAYDPGGRLLISQSYENSELPNVVGKELADRIIADQSTAKSKSYSGLDLKVGGEGMKGFYDKILVDYANKFGKKFGARVEPSQLRVTDTPDSEYEKYPAEHPYRQKNFPIVHSMSITPEMRKSAMEGVAQFQPKTFIVRHGSTEMNNADPDKDLIRGHINVPLDAKGKKEAQETAQQIAAQGGVQHIIASDLDRTVDTAKAIQDANPGSTITEDSGLRPWAFGPTIEGKPTTEMLPKIAELTENPDRRPPGGETFNEFKDRFLEAYHRAQDSTRDANSAIVTHYRGTKLLDAWRKAGTDNDNIDKATFESYDKNKKPGHVDVIDKNGQKLEKSATGEAIVEQPAREQAAGGQPEAGANIPAQAQFSPAKRRSRDDFKLPEGGPGLFQKAWIMPDGRPVQLGDQMHHDWLNDNPSIKKQYGIKGSDEDNRVEALQKGFARVNYEKNTGTLTVEARAIDWPKLRDSVKQFASVNLDKIDNMDVHLLDPKAKKVVASDGVQLHSYPTIEEKMEQLPFIGTGGGVTEVSPQASSLGGQYLPSTEPRALRSAAVRDPETGQIFEAPFHAMAVQHALGLPGYRDVTPEKLASFEHGFTTNEGEFLDRAQSAARAAEMNQLQQGVGPAQMEHKGGIGIEHLKNDVLTQMNENRKNAMPQLMQATPKKTIAAFKDEKLLPEALHNSRYAIITANRESVGPANHPENQQANDALEKELIADGYQPQPVSGEYKGVDQGKSFLVPDMTAEDAIRYAKNYGQESVLGPEGLIYQNGEVNPAIPSDSVVGEAAKKRDGWSQVEGGPSFSMGLDFDKRVPLAQFSPNEVAGDGWDPESPVSETMGKQFEGPISPGKPTKLEHQKDELSLEHVLASPGMKKFADTVAAHFKTVPGFRDLKGGTAKVINSVIDRMASNLKFLFDRATSGERERWRKWYDLAHDMTERWAPEYDVHPDVVAAVNARLSPQTEWNNNVTLTRAVLDTFRQNPKVTQADKDFLHSKIAQMKDAKERASWKKEIDDMEIGTHMDELSDRQAGMLLRSTNELKGALKTHDHNLQPIEGQVTGWGKPFDDLRSVISILRNPTAENVDAELGNNHKVRSFYNNHVAPESPKWTTIDTHQVAASTLLPVGGSDAVVKANFGNPKHKHSGYNGTYFVYQEALRKVAKETGLLPREVQSIVWEKIRQMMKPEIKRILQKDPSAITDIHARVEKGELTPEQGRDEIAQVLFRLAIGWRTNK